MGTRGLRLSGSASRSGDCHWPPKHCSANMKLGVPVGVQEFFGSVPPVANKIAIFSLATLANDRLFRQLRRHKNHDASFDPSRPGSVLLAGSRPGATASQPASASGLAPCSPNHSQHSRKKTENTNPSFIFTCSEACRHSVVGREFWKLKRCWIPLTARYGLADAPAVVVRPFHFPVARRC